MRKLLDLLRITYENIIRNINGPVGVRLRRWHYSRHFGRCGRNLKIDIGVVITSPRDVFVGDNVWIDNYVLIYSGEPKGNRRIMQKAIPEYKYERGQLHIDSNVHLAPFVVIQSHGGISIGANCTIASGSKIYSMSHHYRNLMDNSDNNTYFFSSMSDRDDQFLISAPVVIGEATAIGLNSTVLPGTHIPDGAWMGVQTFLQGTKVEGNSVYAADAAKLIKKK